MAERTGNPATFTLWPIAKVTHRSSINICSGFGVASLREGMSKERRSDWFGKTFEARVWTRPKGPWRDSTGGKVGDIRTFNLALLGVMGILAHTARLDIEEIWIYIKRLDTSCRTSFLFQELIPQYDETTVLFYKTILNTPDPHI